MTTYTPNSSEFNSRNLVVKVCAIFAIGVFAQLALFHFTREPVRIPTQRHLALARSTSRRARPVGLPSTHGANLRAIVQRRANGNHGTDISFIQRSVPRSSVTPTVNPRTCKCRLNTDPQRRCRYFRASNSVKCKLGRCKDEYVCDPNAKNGITCERRKRDSHVTLVSGSTDECYNESVSDYVYVPYTT